jgi:O-antigen/teichoic acid export membrane protein
LPYAAQVQERCGIGEAGGLAKRIAVLSVGGTALYWAIIIPLRLPVLQTLYSGKYNSVAYLIPWVALGSLLWSAGYAPGIILRAMEHPRLVFFSLCASSIATLLVGIPATYFLGLWGVVVWGLLSSNAVALVLVVCLLRWKLKADRDHTVSSEDYSGHAPETAETYVAN